MACSLAVFGVCEDFGGFASRCCFGLTVVCLIWGGAEMGVGGCKVCQVFLLTTKVSFLFVSCSCCFFGCSHFRHSLACLFLF